MVITGAGPGIMQAAMEGAGREQSIGVSIRLPFEQGANPVIAGDAKYVSMKYFFTRKLMLVKESSAFVCLPGGFGTLDETFELLTLTQTGKGVPVPIVFLDTPGDPYWEEVAEFVEHPAGAPAASSRPRDAKLYSVTDTCEAAVDEINRFYSNYDSMRYVGELLVVRMKHAPTDEQLAELNTTFGHLCTAGSIERVDAAADRGQGGRPRRASSGSRSRSPSTVRRSAPADRHAEQLRRRVAWRRCDDSVRMPDLDVSGEVDARRPSRSAAARRERHRRRPHVGPARRAARGDRQRPQGSPASSRLGRAQPATAAASRSRCRTAATVRQPTTPTSTNELSAAIDHPVSLWAKQPADEHRVTTVVASPTTPT